MHFQHLQQDKLTLQNWVTSRKTDTVTIKTKLLENKAPLLIRREIVRESGDRFGTAQAHF